MAEETDNNGELKYGESHIMCNLFSTKAIEKIAEKTLPYHIAFKKINHYIDGNLIADVKEEALRNILIKHVINKRFTGESQKRIRRLKIKKENKQNQDEKH